MIKSLIQKVLGFESRRESPVASAKTEIGKQELAAALRQASVLMDRQDVDGCIRLLAPIVPAQPEDGMFFSLLGRALYAKKEWSQAAYSLTRAADLGYGDARIHAMLVSSLVSLAQFDDALGWAMKAYEQGPHDAIICTFLGQIHARNGAFELASRFYQEALELSPRNLEILLSIVRLNMSAQHILRKSFMSGRALQAQKQCLKKLAAAYVQGKKLTDLELYALLLLGLEGEESFARYSVPLAEKAYQKQEIDQLTALVVGQVFSLLGDSSRTIEMYECAAEGEGKNGQLRHMLGNLLIARGGDQASKGWQIWNEYYASQMSSSVPVWKGEKLGKKKLFVFREQGIGDFFIGLRLLKTLKDKGIRFTCWVGPEAAGLLSACDCIDELATDETRPDPEKYACDFQVSLFSLFHLLKLDAGDFKSLPVIPAPSGRCEDLKRDIAAQPGLKLGLVASGNVWRFDDWLRTVSPATLAPLATIEGVSWVNLAVDPRSERDQTIAMFKALDPTPGLHDFADTAAIVDSLDAIVAIDCSVAHLAAAMGKPVFVLAPSTIEWRWRVGENTRPWWPNAQTFFSLSPGDWQEALCELTDALREFVTRHRGD